MAEADRRSRYDAYWQARNTERTRARSRERAAVAVELLKQAGRLRGRLLEVGCGPGWALEVFQDAGFDVAGADCSPRAVADPGLAWTASGPLRPAALDSGESPTVPRFKRCPNHKSRCSDQSVR